MKKYWLMKSEPESFSIDDLAREKVTRWEGVRNFQARNHMRNMQVGDLMLFHHSSVIPPGVVGLGKIVKAAYPDLSQFDKKGHYFEPRATEEKPVWSVVDVGFEKKFQRLIPIGELRANPKLKGLILTEIGSRLSVMPVSEAHFKEILSIAKKKNKALF